MFPSLSPRKFSRQARFQCVNMTRHSEQPDFSEQAVSRENCFSPPGERPATRKPAPAMLAATAPSMAINVLSNSARNFSSRDTGRLGIKARPLAAALASASPRSPRWENAQTNPAAGIIAGAILLCKREDNDRRCTLKYPRSAPTTKRRREKFSFSIPFPSAQLRRAALHQPPTPVWLSPLTFLPSRKLVSI